MIRTFPPIYQWFFVIILSVVVSLLFLYLQIPAAWLLGSMVVSIVFSLTGTTIQMPSLLFTAAQITLGCMIARSMSSTLLEPLQQNWFIIMLILLVTLSASIFTGWYLVKYSPLPGSTGAWATAPGGASTMVVMSADYGADMRLVAFIQYLRVLLVIIVAAIIANILKPSDVETVYHQYVWLPDVTFPLTVIIAIAGCWIGRRFSIPSGAMLIPMCLTAFCKGEGWITLILPDWLLTLTYCIVGICVGLRFNLSILKVAIRSLPQIIFSIVFLMVICFLSAIFLHITTGTDMLTAYLATSPGGLDTMVIIAVGTHSNIALVASIQTLRLLLVLFTSPFIARYLSKNDKKIE